jgi:hypothetical protein
MCVTNYTPNFKKSKTTSIFKNESMKGKQKYYEFYRSRIYVTVFKTAALVLLLNSCTSTPAEQLH